MGKHEHWPRGGALGSQKWVMIVAGGIMQVPAVEAAHDLGYNALVTDRDPDCACRPIADAFEQINTFDVDGHVALAKSWANDLRAVFTAAADPIFTVANAAWAIGRHGIPVDIAARCADKGRTRDTLKCRTRDTLNTHGVNQPRYRRVCGADEIHAYVWKDIDAEYIVKATSSSGSRGHTRASGADLRTGYADLAYRRAAQYSRTPWVLIEDVLYGTELSVETLWYDGHMIPLNAVERPFMPGTAIELGHYNPALLSSVAHEKVWNIMLDAGYAIGMGETSGGHILKGDLILSKGEPAVLELTTRLSGGFDSGWTSPLAHGVNYTRGALKLALGYPLDVAMPDFVPLWYRHAAAWAVFGPPDGGIIKEINGLDKARAECHDVIMRFKVGDELPPLVDCGARVGFCIYGDASPEKARHYAQAAAEKIKVVCE